MSEPNGRLEYVQVYFVAKYLLEAMVSAMAETAIRLELTEGNVEDT